MCSSDLFPSHDNQRLISIDGITYSISQIKEKCIPLPDSLPNSWDLTIEKTRYYDYENIIDSPDEIFVKMVTLIRSIMKINYGKEPSCEELVDIMRNRDKMGWAKYKKSFKPFDGRDFLQESLEELLDGIVYFTNYCYEKEVKEA